MGYVSGNVVLGNVVLRTVEKTTPLTPAEYNGFARAGEMVIDPNTFPPTLYVGDRNGQLNPIAGGSGGTIINYFNANTIIGNTITSNTINSNTLYANYGNFNNLYSNGNVNFNDSSNVSLGNVANLHILGGLPGQFLQTVYGNNPGPDGTLQWAYPTGDPSFSVGFGTSTTTMADSGQLIYLPPLFATNNWAVPLSLDFDTAGNFNTGSGVFTVSKAGYYQINVNVVLRNVGNDFSALVVSLFKNGAEFKQLWRAWACTFGGGAGGGGSVLMRLNVGDTLDVRHIWGFVNGSGFGQPINGHFSGTWLRPL